MKKVIFCAALACALGIPSSAWCENDGQLHELQKSVAELKQMVQALQKTVQTQQEELVGLKKEKGELAVSQSAVTPPASHFTANSPGLVAGTTPKKGNYLPEIGLVADIVGKSSESSEDAEGNDRFSARAVELVIGHDIDPYSRLDATISFSDFEEAAVEEAYASFWDLPLDSKLRFGLLKPKIGLVAAVHRDSLDTVDEPLVIQAYLGAEGMNKAGFDLTAFTPFSSDWFTQQITLGFLAGGGGEDGQLFGTESRYPTLYARVKNSVDFSDVTNADIGATYLNGNSTDDDERNVNTVEIDATLSHHLSPTSKFKFQNEAYINHESSTWGYYSLADYRLNERFALGSRWDWVEPIELEENATRDYEQALAAYLTFFQSEFARWRLQYQHAWLQDDSVDNIFYLQGTFAIGTHKHALQ